jgi:PST family polysaccharide transporter
MSLRDKAIKGVFWSAVQNWGQNLINLVVFFVLANILGPGLIGRVAYAMVFVAVLAIFQRQGIAQAVVQRKEVERGHLDTVFWTSVAAGLVLAGGLALLAHPIALALDKTWLAPVLQALSLILFVDSLATTPQAILRRDMAFKSLAVRWLVSSVAGGAVGITMALCGFGIWSLVGQRLTASLAGTVALWLASRWRPSVEVSMRHLRDMLGFGVFIMGNETLATVNRQIGPLLIGTFLGDVALGFYQMGYQLLQAMTQLFTRTVSAVALPTFSRLQDDYAQMRNALITATRMTSLLAFPAFLGAAVIAPEFIGLFREAWAPSIRIMQILALLGVVQSVTFFNGPVIMACGKPSWAFLLALSNTLANVLVFTIAVHWGIVVVAAAFAVRGYLYAPFPLLAVRRLISLDILAYVRQYVAPTLGSLVMVVGVWSVKRALGTALNEAGLLAVSLATGVIVYGACLRILAPGRMRQALELIRLAVR